MCAASWHLPGIFKISAPVTTQCNLNVRAPMAQAYWEVAVGRQWAGSVCPRTAALVEGWQDQPAKGSSHEPTSHTAQLSSDILNPGKKTLLGAAVEVMKTWECTDASQLSPRRTAGVDTPIPQNPTKVLSRGEGGPRGQYLPRLYSHSCHWPGHSHPAWTAKCSVTLYS